MRSFFAFTLIALLLLPNLSFAEDTSSVAENRLAAAKQLLEDKAEADEANPEAPRFDFNTKSEDETEGLGLRMTQGLMFCLVALCILVYVMKRLGLTRTDLGERRLKVIERAALSPKSAVFLVSLDGREFLVGQGSEPVNLISPVEKQFATELQEQFPQAIDFNAHQATTVQEGPSVALQSSSEQAQEEFMEEKCEEELKLSA